MKDWCILGTKSLLPFLILQAITGAACFAGPTVPSHQAGNIIPKSVLIVSEPTGASVSINGQRVGTTPCVVDLAVKPDGQCVRPLLIRAEKLPAFAYEGERFFPGKEKDGTSNFVPSVLRFDLNVQRVVTLR